MGPYGLWPPFHLLTLGPLCMHMRMEWSLPSLGTTEIEFNKEAGDQTDDMARLNPLVFPSFGILIPPPSTLIPQ